MEEDRVYRHEGLSVATLAARLSLPEYRLRRLINQRLGHRNFTSYVNGYRLAEVVAALSDPTQAQVPILTIALDAGFQSIGPFNRAFKAQTGMTPTDFRREHMGNGAQNAAE
jgi:AraC-like DNA-binding protein